jgi:hypothetical protein
MLQAALFNNLVRIKGLLFLRHILVGKAIFDDRKITWGTRVNNDWSTK